MRSAELVKMTCTVARAVDAFGDAWTMMVIKELFLGQRRFDDIRTYTGISPHLLSVRMKKLEKHGIVERRIYRDRPTRYEYRLTAKGADLWPILIAAKDWSAKWDEWPDGEPLKVRHKGCGQVTSLKVVCSGCHEPINARDVRTEMSAAMISERARMAGRVEKRKE
jgi:DNA-binding HxlR family transcriptional regulator